MICNVIASMTELQSGIDYIKDNLKGIDSKEKIKMMLLAEEIMVKMFEVSENGIEITVKKLFGKYTVKLVSKGERFDIEKTDLGVAIDTDDMSIETENVIRGMLFNSFGDRLKYKHTGGINTVLISQEKKNVNTVLLTLAALAAAVIVGSVLRNFAPSNISEMLNKYVFSAFQTMFLNALKMIVAPVVFFSLVSCVSQFGSISEIGKIGIKIMALYMLTTVIAIFIGFGIYNVFKPGTPDMMPDTAGVEVNIASADISLRDTIVNIVPSNFVKPFIDADMLQIIFIALLCGAAVGAIGEYSKILKDLFEACNLLFLTITKSIAKFIPLAVFCSITSLVIKTGPETLMSLFGMIAVFVGGLACMILVYMLLILVVGRLNPLVFIKKYAPNMLMAFSLGSSNAVMPDNMRCCDEKLGISPKVYSFSIPLGATVNMDGSSIYLMVAGLFLAKIYGIDMTWALLAKMMFSVFVLSMGAPGVPGSGLVCLSVLIIPLGIPVEALSLVMGIDSIMGMFRAMSNVTGDMAVTLAVAKTENAVDKNVYYG